jgi:hypothetical protein
VYEIDEWGLPWIRCRFRRKDGSWEHHYLAIHDDSWVRVKPRIGEWLGKVTKQNRHGEWDTGPATGREVW